MSTPLLPRLRRAGIALIAGTAFLFASTEAAVASTLSGPGLPEPTPIVLFDDEIPEAPLSVEAQPEAEAMVGPDIPARVPAQLGAGKMVLVLFALIGIVALVGIAILAYGLYTLLNSDV